MAYCPNCGAEVADEAKFCPVCGRAQGGSTVTPGTAAARRTEGTAIASMTLGILGIIGLLFIGPILALVFGYQARKRIAEDPSLDGGGMATAGIVMGWVGIALSFFFLIGFIAAMNKINEIEPVFGMIATLFAI